MKILPPLGWLLRSRATEFVVHWETLAGKKAEAIPPLELLRLRRVGAFQTSLWTAWRWSQRFSRQFEAGSVRIFPVDSPDEAIAA